MGDFVRVTGVTLQTAQGGLLVQPFTLSLSQQALTVRAVLSSGGSATPTDLILNWSSSMSEFLKFDEEKTAAANASDGGNDIIDGTVYGVFVPLAKGTSKISAISRDGGFKAEISVTVTGEFIGVKSVLISAPATIPLTATGQTAITLSANLTPSNPTYGGVIWSYINPTGQPVARIASNGVVTPLRNGTFTAVATTVDGTARATRPISIVTPATAYWLDTSFPLTLIQGATKTIKANALPVGATLGTLTSTVSGDSALIPGTFSATGTAVITAGTASGRTTITVQTPIGGTEKGPQKSASEDTAVNPLVVNVLPPNPFYINILNVSPQGYSSKNGLVDTVNLTRSSVFNIPVELNMHSELYETYNDVNWTTAPPSASATPALTSTPLIITAIAGKFPSCNVRINPAYTGPLTTIVLTGTTVVGGLKDSVTLVVPPSTVRIVGVSFDTNNIVPFSKYTPVNGSTPGFLSGLVVGEVGYVPAIINPATGLPDTTLVWTVSVAGIITIVPSSGQLIGCNFTAISTGTTVLTATSLARGVDLAQRVATISITVA